MPSNHLILCHPLLLLPSIIPASGSFPISQLFAPGGQSIEVSASTSVPPMNTQDWSSLGWTGWISLQSKGLSGGFSNTTVQSINSSALSFFYRPTHILCFITVLYICQYWSPDPSHSLSPLVPTHLFSMPMFLLMSRPCTFCWSERDFLNCQCISLDICTTHTEPSIFYLELLFSHLPTWTVSSGRARAFYHCTNTWHHAWHIVGPQ